MFFLSTVWVDIPRTCEVEDSLDTNTKFNAPQSPLIEPLRCVEVAAMLSVCRERWREREREELERERSSWTHRKLILQSITCNLQERKLPMIRMSKDYVIILI